VQQGKGRKKQKARKFDVEAALLQQLHKDPKAGGAGE